MKTRRLVAAAAVATLALAACGGSDGPKALSEDDFTDQLGELCTDTNKDMDKLQSRDMSDYPDFADAAGDAVDILTDTRAELDKIIPPKSMADDYKDFIGVVDDQIDAFGDFQKAADDKDDDAMQKASDRLDKLTSEGNDIADDLGVDDCISEQDTTDTTEPDTTEPATTEAAPTTTEAPETTVAMTLPPTVPPATVPETTTFETVPSDTEVPGQLFSVVDLSSIFVAPDGFTLIDSDPAARQAFIQIVASIPELNSGIQEMGVGVLQNDDDGTAIATIVVGVAIGDAMPGQWKDILCSDGTLRTSAGGYTGVTCPGSASSGITDIFTMTEGDVGLSVASLIDTVPADLVVDAFFEANFS